MKHIQRSQKPKLIKSVAALFGNREAPIQGHARGIACSAHEHQGHSEVRLKPHLLEPAESSIGESKKSAFRPAMAFRQQRHRQKYGRGGDDKSDADGNIAVDAKAPFQGRARIVESRKVGRALRPGRQGRPVASVLLEPSAVIIGVTDGQVGKLRLVDPGFEDVSARGVQEPVAHHRPDRTGGDHRLGDEAVDGAKNERLIDGWAGHDGQRRIKGEMTDKDCQSTQHPALHFG